MNDFVQDRGVERIRNILKDGDTVHLLLIPNDMGTGRLGLQVSKKFANYRASMDLSKKNRISHGGGFIIVAGINSDEFENCIVPLVDNGSIKHVHEDRQVSF